MKTFPRGDRVAAHIQKVLSELLRKRIKDPRLEMVVITGVKMSKDIKNAHIFYTITGGEQATAAAAQGFDDACGFIRRALAKQLGLRYMPGIRFFYDKSVDYGAHIDTLIKSIHADVRPDHTETEEE